MALPMKDAGKAKGGKAVPGKKAPPFGKDMPKKGKAKAKK